MSTLRVAVPAETSQGLESPISGHFGHSPSFVIVSITDGKVESVETLLNSGHSSCAEPVQRLAQSGVTVLIARGMGMRPLVHSQNMGITVVISAGNTVREAIENYLNGQSTIMGMDHTCQGGGRHH